VEFAQKLEGYSGSDIKLVCEEAAMKPLRRLMQEMDSVTKIDTTDWTRPADPRSAPTIGPVTSEDFARALESTKSSAQAVKFEKYEKWMAEFGSV
jgi:katanin p60 ATPase-containing subunit A1